MFQEVETAPGSRRLPIIRLTICRVPIPSHSLPQVTAPPPPCAALICPVRRVGAAAGGVAGPGRQHNCTAQFCPVVQEEELAALEAECDMYRQTNGELTERSVVLCHR